MITFVWVCERERVSGWLYVRVCLAICESVCVCCAGQLRSAWVRSRVEAVGQLGVKTTNCFIMRNASDKRQIHTQRQLPGHMCVHTRGFRERWGGGGGVALIHLKLKQSPVSYCISRWAQFLGTLAKLKSHSTNNGDFRQLPYRRRGGEEWWSRGVYSGYPTDIVRAMLRSYCVLSKRATPLKNISLRSPN